MGLNPILNVDPNGDDFYQNNITGKIEEHPHGWPIKLNETERRNWTNIGRYKATDWSGNPYYNDYSRFYTLARLAEHSESLEGSYDPGNSGYNSPKETKVTKDVILISGAVVSILATGGASGFLAAFTFTSSTVAVLGGSSKLIFDLKGDYEKSDNVPTNLLDGAYKVTLSITKGKENKTVTAVVNVVDGVMTLNPTELPKNFLDGMDKGLSSVNLVITLVEQNDNLKKKDNENKPR